MPLRGAAAAGADAEADGAGAGAPPAGAAAPGAASPSCSGAALGSACPGKETKIIGPKIGSTAATPITSPSGRERKMETSSATNRLAA